MPLLGDLQALRTRLRGISAHFDSAGDLVSSRRIDSVILSIEDAIRKAQAQDIIAGLPNDADAQKAAAMLANMNAVATNINAAQADVSKIVSRATAVANVVSDLVLGQYGAAAAAAADLAG